jgi:hypothetical protein
MTNDFAPPGINPFRNDIIRAPSEVSFSVAGLNDKPLERLVATFVQLTKGALPRSPIPAPKAQLILSPDAGYGKSHLLGRLFEKLANRATLVYLRPFQAPDKAWHTILLTTVQALKSAFHTDQVVRSQLDAFALGVLAHLAADYLAHQPVGNAELRSALDYVREHPLKILAPSLSNNALIDWLKKAPYDESLANELAALLNKREIYLNGREKAWLKVLGAVAFGETYGLEREAALKWIRAEPLEDEESALLKLRVADNEGKGDSSAREIDDLCYSRLRGLCALSAYFRPFVFCFDQTEYYGSDKELGGALGNCVENLCDAVPNHLTIVTANATNWNNDLRPKLEPPQQDRFSPAIVLEGIKFDQAKELITQRLKECNFDDESAAKFLSGGWLDLQFAHLPELGVRRLLSAAAQRFSKLPRLSLTDLFSRHVNEVRAQETLHLYSEACLMWFAEDLIKGYDGVAIAKPRHKYFSVSWDWPDRSVLFAFEEGDHHRRWESIAKEATALSKDARKQVTSIVFRTPDLGKIPKGTWQKVSSQIDEATRRGLRIIELKLDEVCELHAARELYSNALQGNVDYAADEVMKWLKEHFVGGFGRCSRAGSETPQPIATVNGTTLQKDLDLDKAELGILVDKVRMELVVDIKRVLEKLGSPSFELAVLRAVEQHPNLKAHPGPQTIFIQWRNIA